MDDDAGVVTWQVLQFIFYDLIQKICRLCLGSTTPTKSCMRPLSLQRRGSALPSAPNQLRPSP